MFLKSYLIINRNFCFRQELIQLREESDISKVNSRLALMEKQQEVGDCKEKIRVLLDEMASFLLTLKQSTDSKFIVILSINLFLLLNLKEKLQKLYLYQVGFILLQNAAFVKICLCYLIILSKLLPSRWWYPPYYVMKTSKMKASYLPMINLTGEL